MIKTLKKNPFRIYTSNTLLLCLLMNPAMLIFLLKTLGAEYTIQLANSEFEELHVKYLVEKAQPHTQHFLIYTRSKKDDFIFILEYCETC